MQYDYAKAFRIIRAAFGLRQAELAERISITPSQLSLIEAGKRQPSLRVVNGLGATLGIPPALVSVLASSAADVESKEDQDVSDLARALLRALVSAGQDRQRSIDFGRPS